MQFTHTHSLPTADMGSAYLKALFLVAILFGSSGGTSPEFDSLKVPVLEFVGSVRSTIGIIQQVMSIVSQFSGMLGDFRLGNAVADCLDLMDLSVDQLSWTLSASQNPNGKYNGTGNAKADMKTWSSGALINQDTCKQWRLQPSTKGIKNAGVATACKDGFDGTNAIVKDLVAGSLDQVTSLLINILSNIKPNTPPSTTRKLISSKGFPDWLKPLDRRDLLQPGAATADAVVAADGTGTFRSIEDAMGAAPEYSSKRFVIYIKRGVYKEYVEIGKKKWNIMMIGDGVNATVITGNRSFIDGWTTYRSSTFAVKGQGFIARDITFENTAGPEKHQAVAFRSDSDLSVLYRCAFHGYQDTLYAHSQRQFYRECKITGTIDFIFGDGAAVFQNCQIMARKGLLSQKNTITAQGRKEPVENTGFSIQFSNISVEADVSNSTQTYLGRPWKLYTRTVIMQSYISNAIRPEGWLEWNENFALDTLYYGEYMNYGPGSSVGSRVKWPGYRAFNTSAQAYNFTVSQFITGNSWLPSTGVKYTAGLRV